MMSTLAILGFWLAAGPQDPHEARVRAVVERHFARLPAERREAIARDLASKVPWGNWRPEDEARIVTLIEHTVAGTLWAADSAESVSKDLAKVLEGGSAQGLATPPPGFRDAAEALALDRAGALSQELLAHAPPAAAERAAMSAQLDDLARLLDTEARRIVQGSEADAMVRDIVDSGVRDWRGVMGDVLAGGVYRPLSDAEYQAVASAIRNRAKDFPVLEPGSEESAAKARASLTALVSELGGWHRACYPRMGALRDESERLSRRVYDWREESIRRINNRLEPEREEWERFKRDLDARLKSTPGPGTERRDPERRPETAELPASPPAAPPPPSPPKPPPASRRSVISTVLLLVAAAALVAVVLRSRRAA
jgi:hypothetical protein